VRRLSPPNPNL
jgi:hypothetical protein